MKRLVVLAGFLFAGILVAITAIFIVGTLDNNPGCGLDCPSPDLNIALYFGLVIILAFPLLGYIFTRGNHLTMRRICASMITLTLAALFAIACFYVFKLHSKYMAAEFARPVRPDFEFMYMAIATREIQAYSEANGGAGAKRVIPQWQRCVIDGAWCDRKIKMARMRCKVGIVDVSELDWNAFSLVPRENLPGAVPMKSMNLCDENNKSDFN
ncbi:hypothetical protein [Paraburkholderia hayleyella]|uniref:hypothetical protein n=1 Tax=Paraburkholderia hayleyella TaxID=2152889 RepID=UPI0012918C10|nr:hypothetical protein [Paraburkholderia hayleyella]